MYNYSDRSGCITVTSQGSFIPGAIKWWVMLRLLSRDQSKTLSLHDVIIYREGIFIMSRIFWLN